MPKTDRPQMARYAFRCPDAMWALVEREAGADGVGNSEVVRRALRYYFDRGVRTAPDTQGER